MKPSERTPSRRVAAPEPPGNSATASAITAMMPTFRAAPLLTRTSVGPKASITAKGCHYSCMLDGVRFDYVGGRLAGVGRLLDPLEDVFSADHDHRVGAVREERGEGLAQDPVALVLEAIHLDELV